MIKIILIILLFNLLHVLAVDSHCQGVQLWQKNFIDVGTYIPLTIYSHADLGIYIQSLVYQWVTLKFGVAACLVGKVSLKLVRDVYK